MLIKNHGWNKLRVYWEDIEYETQASMWFISHFPRRIDNPAGILGIMHYSLGVF